MVNQFNNITDSNTFENTLNQLQVKNRCCGSCEWISPSGQRYKLKQLFDFAETHKYLNSNTLDTFKALNDQHRVRYVPYNSTACLEWIVALLKYVGHLIGRCFGMSSYSQDLQKGIDRVRSTLPSADNSVTPEQAALDQHLLNPPYGTFTTYLKMYSEEQLTSFVKRHCPKDSQNFRNLIGSLPEDSLVHYLSIITKAAECDVWEFAIKLLDTKNRTIPLPHKYYCNFIAFYLIKIIRESKTNTVIPNFLKTVLACNLQAMLRDDTPPSFAGEIGCKVGHICTTQELSSLIDFCKKMPLHYSIVFRLFKGILLSNDKEKVEVMIEAFWPFLKSIADDQYLRYVPRLFNEVHNASTLSWILSTFPTDGESKWLIHLLSPTLVKYNDSVRTPPKVTPGEIRELLKLNVHIYSHIKTSLLPTIFSDSTLRAEVENDIREYETGLSAALLGTPLAEVTIRIVKDYLFSKAQILNTTV